MILPEMTNLYGPYTGDGSTLEMFVQFIHKQGRDRNIDPLIMDAVLVEIFLELANGKMWPKDHCPCGCGINKSSTALAHETLARAIELDKTKKAEYAEGLRRQVERIVLDHVERENAAYVSENMPPPKDRWYKRIFREMMDRGEVTPL